MEFSPHFFIFFPSCEICWFGNRASFWNIFNKLLSHLKHCTLWILNRWEDSDYRQRAVNSNCAIMFSSFFLASFYPHFFSLCQLSKDFCNDNWPHLSSWQMIFRESCFWITFFFMKKKIALSLNYRLKIVYRKYRSDFS